VRRYPTTRADRVGNERRLSAIASEIAGRSVHVHCPGPLGRVLGKDSTVEGFVRFDADGRPAAETRLQPTILCGPRGTELAMAVDVLTHESFHLQGIQDEARTECDALQTMAETAVRLGATPAQGAALARGQLAESYPRMPDQYRSGECADGGAFDLRPDDPSWP
jgi:hypothetical protein